jgi:hypothetical protein
VGASKRSLTRFLDRAILLLRIKQATVISQLPCILEKLALRIEQFERSELATVDIVCPQNFGNEAGWIALLSPKDIGFKEIGHDSLIMRSMQSSRLLQTLAQDLAKC